MYIIIRHPDHTNPKTLRYRYRAPLSSLMSHTNKVSRARKFGTREEAERIALANESVVAMSEVANDG